MYDSLIKYINSFASAPLTESGIEVIKKTFIPKKIRKKQYLLQEGEVCKYMAFVVKGAMRQYSVDDKAAEHIVRLSIENWWAGDRESFTMLTPSIYNIDAWEDTDALLITKADMSLLNQIPAVIQMTRKLDDNHAFAYQKRLNAYISLSAEQRYEDFAKQYPEFLQRFPQHIIASYLGITKETLSRVRRHAVKK
ncbi:MAG TPA: Crp/Fnr family transcriptional regulator [Bacteroidia bacterium]|jgi:CRP-like cAMP-binding protein|nr:Crp/Fnr family transcriptional regulator [Bacteroidia bacterium]